MTATPAHWLISDPDKVLGREQIASDNWFHDHPDQAFKTKPQPFAVGEGVMGGPVRSVVK